MATRHALTRATDRLGIALDPDTIESIIQTADGFARTCKRDTAVRIMRVSMVGQAWSNQSNGNTIIAIIRGGSVVTFMFRRDTQPFTPEHLSVQEVIDQCS